MLANTARRSVSRTLASGGFRTARALSDDPAGLRKTLGEKIPEWQAEIKTFCKEHGHKSLGETTVNHAYQGMRDLKAMVWETSLLDAQEGIRFRGHSIPELQDVLPKAPGGEEPLPESLLYLLLTDDIPTESQVRELSTSLNERAVLSDYTKKIIEEFPKDMHPMTQFSTAIMSMQRESQFQQKYSSGSLRKADYWVHTLEDSLNVIAKAPIAAAAIYRNTFHGGKDMWAPVDKSLDISANFSNALGSQFGGNETFREMMRLYLTIHADHEGGNVSAHTVHLVGSALSDPYLSLAAGLNGLAGPLHGLANQECLKFQKMIMAKLGSPPYSAEDVRKATWDILNAGQVVPGFGHAVLRKTDPRYMVQREFATKHFPEDALFQLVNRQFEVVPEVLKEHGKTKNPYPNVDAHSGCLLQHFGLKEENYYTVLFGVSRAIGTLSQLVLDRALGFPLERPKSLTTKWLKQNVQ